MSLLRFSVCMLSDTSAHTELKAKVGFPPPQVNLSAHDSSADLTEGLHACFSMLVFACGYVLRGAVEPVVV